MSTFRAWRARQCAACPRPQRISADELDRAQVLAKGRRPIDVVSMGCEVEFRDESTGRVQKVTLVDPREADIEQRKISVLTPVGTALIGLRTGTSITWETGPGSSSGSPLWECGMPRQAEPI